MVLPVGRCRIRGGLQARDENILPIYRVSRYTGVVRTVRGSPPD